MPQTSHASVDPLPSLPANVQLIWHQTCGTPVLAVFRPISQAVAHVFGVDIAGIEHGTRGRADVALARQTAMYLAHVSCGMSMTAVGRLFSRDRTTVAHACAMIEDRRDDPVFDRALELLEMVVRALASERTIAPPTRPSRTA